MPTVRVACRTTAPFSCAAPVALQLAARHRSRVICHTWDGRSMDVVRGMLRVACRPSLVACCMLPPEQAASARTHARAQRARADALVGMAVADEAVKHKALVICAFTLHWPQPPPHMLCAAAAPDPSLQSSFGSQLQQIATAGTEKALLADVTEKNPDASYIELLRLFKVRRSVADAHS
jgi:hypothetical protein